jgi:hypothetical protein
MNFKTQVDEADIYGLHKFLKVSKFASLYEVAKTSVTIEYELHLNLKEWGIKSVDVFIKKITSQIDWEVYCEGLIDSDKEALINAGGKEYSNNTISGFIYIDTTTTNWEIKNDIEFHSDGSFSINSVEIILDENKISLS